MDRGWFRSHALSLNRREWLKYSGLSLSLTQWLGAPSYLRGSFAFYKSVSCGSGSAAQVWKLGEFYYVRCGPEEPVGIAEVWILIAVLDCTLYLPYKGCIQGGDCVERCRWILNICSSLRISTWLWTFCNIAPSWTDPRVLGLIPSCATVPITYLL